MVTSSLSSYDLISNSSSKLHSAYVDVTLALIEGMVDYSTTLTRSYSSVLIHYLVPLELYHDITLIPLLLLKPRSLRWPDCWHAENIAISACSEIFPTSTNMVGQANITYICISGFKPSGNIYNSALLSGTKSPSSNVSF